MDIYLVTPKSQLKCFVRSEDREYFARPVLVETLHSVLATRLVFVRDPARGNSYLCDPANLRPEYRLTQAQRKLI